jgi:hypothetical protein
MGFFSPVTKFVSDTATKVLQPVEKAVVPVAGLVFNHATQTLAGTENIVTGTNFIGKVRDQLGNYLNESTAGRFNLHSADILTDDYKKISGIAGAVAVTALTAGATSPAVGASTTASTTINTTKTMSSINWGNVISSTAPSVIGLAGQLIKPQNQIATPQPLPITQFPPPFDPRTNAGQGNQPNTSTPPHYIFLGIGLLVVVLFLTLNKK